MTFIDSVKSLFVNYANFKGRASRSAYWWAQLFILAPALLFSLIDITTLSTLWTLATIVPAISVLARRLHDSGKSAWLILLGFIPLVGAIAIVVLAVLPSNPHENRYGPGPEEATEHNQRRTVAKASDMQSGNSASAGSSDTPGHQVAFDLASEDRTLAECLKSFPDSDSLSENNSDYPFFDQWYAVVRERLSKFDQVKDANDPSYGEKEEKARRKKLLEAEGTDAADYINAASRSLEERFNSLLSDSAKVDDFVSAEDLKWGTRNLPDFSSDFIDPAPQPSPLVLRPEPVLDLPKENFFTRLPLISKLHSDRVAKMQIRHEADHQAWESEKESLPGRQKVALEEWMRKESLRKERLAESRGKYDEAVQEWLSGVTEQNREIDELFGKASQGDQTAVEEYFGIVVSTASYPEEFRPESLFRFEPSGRELSVSLTLPDPKTLEKLVTYKYQKGSLSLEPQPPTAAKLKSLYSSLIAQLVVRVGHEVAEADRGKILQAISVQAFVNDFDPLSNQDGKVLVAQVVATAEKWKGLNIDGPDGKAMLKVLGGEISANPAEKLKLSPKGSIGRA